jgi:hypothetical protein
MKKTTKKTVRVIVGRHAEDLDWLVLLPEDYQIYISNSGEEILDIPNNIADRTVVARVENTGREAGHWLRYIVSNYENLADINVFLQGSPHIGHTPNVLFKIERHDIEGKGFCYLCSDRKPTRLLGEGSFQPRTLIGTAVGRKFPIVELSTGGVWGAQHYATKKTIQNYPLEWYSSILSKANKPMFAHTFEHAWNVIYGVPPEIMPDASGENLQNG